MSMSQPSREVYAVDVPEPSDLVAAFQYHFFTPDESVNETGGVPASALSRPADQIDASYIQYAVTRVPRVVTLQYSLPKLADVGNQVSEQLQRSNANSFGGNGAQDGSLILRNIDKVVNEDFLATNGFVSISFHDGEIDDRVHALVSGSLVQQTLEDEHDSNTSHYKAAQRLAGLVPGDIKPSFLSRALSQPKQSYGASFYAAPASSAGTGNSGGLLPPTSGKAVINAWLEALKAVSVNVQVNSRLLQGMLDRVIRDPTAPNAADLSNLHGYAKSAKQAAGQRLSPAISEADYKSYLPFISVKKQNTAMQAQKYVSELVGYIIDKFEVMPDGTVKAHAPIVVDSPHAGLTADFQVKFNATYCYAVRTVALMTLQAIDDDNGDVATLQVLVSSKPSNKAYVKTLDLTAPPAPPDIDFTWDYENNQLMVSWAFPVTSQRDIKQFQVFRRKDVNEPFELQKAYNFDDSVVKFPEAEHPDPRLVEHLTSPCTFFIDSEFDWDINRSQQQSFIYAIAAIDAHGLTSNFSAQFQVWFDRFKNQLQLKLVSHAGAPKPYPNLYLDGDVFANTIKVHGPNSKQMKLYFNPEYFYLYDDSNRYVRVLATNQVGGSYKLQFINTDNGKSQDIDIGIDDLTDITAGTSADQATVRFGPRRRAQQPDPSAA